MPNVLVTHQLPLTLSIILCLSYALNIFSNQQFIALTLIPSEVFVTNNRVWTFVTSSFVEGSAFRLVLNIILLFLVTSPQELKFELFDAQFGLFFGCNVLSYTLGTFMWLMIRFFGSDSQSFMIEASYGCGGVIVLLAMYTRRHVGGQPVLAQVPLVTFHYLPTIIVATVTLLRALRFKQETADILFIYFSYFFSWTYLYFVHKVEGEDTHAQAFTFIGMFPEALHPVVLPLSIAVYNFFSMIGLFPKLEMDRRGLQHHLRYHDPSKQSGGAGMDSLNHSHSSPPSSSGGPPLASTSSSTTSGEDLIAERRRAKAIKLLDAKMAELSKEPEGWEDLKDDANSKL